MMQALAREKIVVESSRKCLEEEAKGLEQRRSRLQELQSTGSESLEEGKRELRVAVESLEREKDALKAARNVSIASLRHLRDVDGMGDVPMLTVRARAVMGAVCCCIQCCALCTTLGILL